MCGKYFKKYLLIKYLTRVFQKGLPCQPSELASSSRFNSPVAGRRDWRRWLLPAASAKKRKVFTTRKYRISQNGRKPLEDFMVNWFLVVWIDKERYHSIRLSQYFKVDHTCFSLYLLSSIPGKGSTRSWIFWSLSSTSLESSFRRLPRCPREGSSSSLSPSRNGKVCAVE